MDPFVYRKVSITSIYILAKGKKKIKRNISIEVKPNLTCKVSQKYLGNVRYYKC